MEKSAIEVLTSQVQEKFVAICSNFSTKLLAGMCYYGIAILSNIFDPSLINLYNSLIFLLVVDTIFGVIRALTKDNEKLSPRKFFSSVVKIFVYFMLLAVTHVTEHFIPTLDFVDNILVVYLAVTEILSILRNASDMDINLPILKPLQHRLKKYIGDLEKTIDGEGETSDEQTT